MLDLAYAIFGSLMAFTGLGMFLMAVYVKLDYEVDLRGFWPVSARPGGVSRYVLTSLFGTFFSVVGVVYTLAAQGIGI